MPDRDPGFAQRTRVVVGMGAFDDLPRYCELLGMTRIAVLMDSALAQGPLADRVRRLLPNGRVIPNAAGEPTVVSMEAAAASIADVGADGVVAIGGGSTLDTGKVARCLDKSGLGPLLDGDGPLTRDIPPLIAVPTTAGTGAEMGAGAIVYVPDVDDKILVRRPEFAAETALADGELTMSLPPHITAFTGCDALAQAILAYVGAGWEAVSGQTAVRAIRLILTALPQAVAAPLDRDARRDMMLGSVLSAMAMYNAPPTYSGEHIFAEPIGAHLKVHHGHAAAVFLPLVAAFNQEALRRPYAEIAREVGLADRDSPERDQAGRLVVELESLVAQLGVPPLREVVDDYPLEELAERCARHPDYALNPAPVGHSDAIAILRAAYGER